MRTLGERIAQQLHAGDILVLTGPLGAGKTTFVQGVGTGLGVEGVVTSPTFIVARQHKAGSRGISLMHLDAYRLQSADDLADLDIDDRTPHVTVVEWGGRFIRAISDSWLEVTIGRDVVGDEDSPENGIRVVTLEPHGPLWDNRELEVSHDLGD